MSNPNASLRPFASIAALEAHLEAMAHVQCEEPGLSELDHGLQCAAELARVAPDDPILQLAGLVHDIAHGGVHIRDHDRAGAAAIEGVLGARAAALVARHVAAKRYLAFKSDYARSLSRVSTHSLALQGGPMNAAEAAAFEADPYAQDAIRLRMADEAAKVPGKITPGLDYWRPLLRAVG